MAVMIKVERPLKLCLSETLAEEVDRIVKVIVDACGIQELNSLLASPKTSQKNASKESFSVFSQSLAQVSTIEVQTAQIIAELAITLQKEESTVKEELLFGMFKPLISIPIDVEKSYTLNESPGVEKLSF